MAENKFLPIKNYLQEGGRYKDADDCWYEDAYSFLMHRLGFCGCGIPEYLLPYIYTGLKILKDRPDETFEVSNKRVMDHFKSDEAAYFMWYFFDSRGLTEHGGSVPGWLTPFGEVMLADLEELTNARRN